MFYCFSRRQQDSTLEVPREFVLQLIPDSLPHDESVGIVVVQGYRKKIENPNSFFDFCLHHLSFVRSSVRSHIHFGLVKNEMTLFPGHVSPFSVCLSNTADAIEFEIGTRCSVFCDMPQVVTPRRGASFYFYPLIFCEDLLKRHFAFGHAVSISKNDSVL
jgi:hypothetical protein